ncbi:MAG: glycosyl hydrolase 53 family protein [Marinilabiliaceae bacterium]|nr:glycosyl hydrolase 53 family protein [Marinilabiliaceae bacterium]
MKNKLLLLVLTFLLALNDVNAQTITDTIFDRNAHEDFAFGADISWGGSNFKDKNGVSKDLLTILKEQGVNSVRYRVWYPANGPSGKNEVVARAKAAHDKGFKVMIDFHYSDSWADPGKQYIPSAWEGHTTEQLIQDVYDHTYDVLKALKDVGVTPAWVQIGNETKRGMLWPNGNTNDTPGGMDNFAKMINSGYDAIKAIDSTIQAIVHLPDADENSLYRWMFDALKARGAKWDIIGMSAYPRWAHLDWDVEIEKSIYNMKDMIARYNTKVMVVETGHYWYEPYISNHFLVGLMDEMMKIGALGCFWWEPQATMVGVYELTAWDPNTRRPTIAMDAYLGIKHTDPATVIHISLNEPTNGAIYEESDDITLSAIATHDDGEIAKVTFYVNNKKVVDVIQAPYSYSMANPGEGIYSVYATATDSNGVVVKSKTKSIQVGIATIIQENADGYCGIVNNAGTIDSNHDNFTGAGFINTDNLNGVTVNWTVNFVSEGTYKIEFRYAGTSNRPGIVTINGNEIGTVPFASTGSWDVWNLSSINYIASKTGTYPISVSATLADGLPNIDYLIIKPVDHSVKPVASVTCLDQPTVTFIDNPSKALNDVLICMNQNLHYLEVKCSDKIENIYIYKADGTIIKTLQQVNNNEIVIPYNDLNSGVFLIRIMAIGKSHVRKFIIQ